MPQGFKRLTQVFEQLQQRNRQVDNAYTQETGRLVGADAAPSAKAAENAQRKANDAHNPRP